jgi:small subunit ribosomal protein S18
MKIQSVVMSNKDRIGTRAINGGPRDIASPESRDRNEDKRRDSLPRRRSKPPIDLFLDYKDVETLHPFLGEGGRIVAARMSRLNRKQQRELTRAVKRARQLALLPISDQHSDHR